VPGHPSHPKGPSPRCHLGRYPALEGNPCGQAEAEVDGDAESGKGSARLEYMWIFVGGKQKRVRRPPTIDGMDVNEFLRRNADPIWLH